MVIGDMIMETLIIDPISYVRLEDFVNKVKNEYQMRFVIILDPAISVNETNVGEYGKLCS